MNAPNKLHYQCTSHVGMSGTIFISPENNIPVGQRTVISKSTGSVGAGSSTIMFFDGFKSYGLLKLQLITPPGSLYMLIVLQGHLIMEDHI